MTPFSTFGEVIATGALALSFLTFLVLVIDKKRARWKEVQDAWSEKIHKLQIIQEAEVSRLSVVSQNVLVLQKQVEIFWKGVAYSSSQSLHSPHTPELDRLIEKFQREDMSDYDVEQFRHMLHVILKSPDEPRGAKKAARETLLALYLEYELSHYVISQEEFSYRQIQHIFGEVEVILDTIVEKMDLPPTHAVPPPETPKLLPEAKSPEDTEAR